MDSNHTLLVRAKAEAMQGLAPLAREGLLVRVAPGRTLRQTLTMDLGFSPECVEGRIQTVFLDGSPVDDIDADQARPGCTLALAGAMPGVAGIAMRRGSPVGVFREGVTHHIQGAGQASPKPSAEALVLTLKLFNSVAVECLAAMLAHGVELAPARLADVLEANPLVLDGAAFALDGRELDRAALLAALRGAPLQGSALLLRAQS